MPIAPGNGYLQCEDTRIEYQLITPPDHGDSASNELILLLHEGLGSVSMWRDFPQALAGSTGCSIFSYSRAGYGCSDKCPLPRPVSYMHVEAEKYLSAIIPDLSADRIFLLGHSDGASISTIYAGSNPDPRLTGVVLIAPHFFCEAISIESITAAGDQYRHGDLRDKLKRHHGANVDCAFEGWYQVWLNPAFLQWNITEYISQIKVPILLIQGTEDQYGTKDQFTAVTDKATVLVRECLLEHCGHSPQRDQPESTLAQIKQFVLENR